MSEEYFFKTQEFKPVPLSQSEDYEYMLAVKQEFVATLHKSPYYLKLDDKTRDIERYSDKYQLNQQDNTDSVNPDWRRLPAELKVKGRKVKRLKSSLKPKIPQRKKADADANEIVKTLETLEKKEETNVEVEEGGGDKEEDEEDKDDDAEEIGDDEIYDEDDLEEETDYAFNYFDNGEGYGDDDGDDDEGPVY